MLHFGVVIVAAAANKVLTALRNSRFLLVLFGKINLTQNVMLYISFSSFMTE